MFGGTGFGDTNNFIPTAPGTARHRQERGLTRTPGMPAWGRPQGDEMETLGGSANDPRWRENGGHWGRRTHEAASGSGGGSNMSAYSQQAFGMPQAGHERTANQRRADRSAAFTRMHGGSQQAAPMAAYSPQQSAPQSGMQAWGQQSGQRMVPHDRFAVMVPEQSGGPGRAQAPTGSRDAEGRRWTEDGRLLKNDPREEMQRLQQTRVGDGSASAWDHPQNAAVRARVERQIQEYDNDPYDQLAYFTQGAASPGQPGRAQSIQPQSQGTPYTPPSQQGPSFGPSQLRGGPATLPQQQAPLGQMPWADLPPGSSPDLYQRPLQVGEMTPEARRSRVESDIGADVRRQQRAYMENNPGRGIGDMHRDWERADFRASPWMSNTPRADSAPRPSQPAPRPSNSAFADAWNFSMEGNASRMAPARTFGGGGAGNMAYMPGLSLPGGGNFSTGVTPGMPAFSMQTIGMDGRPADLQSALAQRDAFVQGLNQAGAPFAMARGLGQNIGPQVIDHNAIMREANNSVKAGYVNPFATYFGGGGQDLLIARLQQAGYPVGMFGD
jgi:hypothetical protein